MRPRRCRRHTRSLYTNTMIFCNTCGADVTTNAQEHEAIHNAGFSSRKIQTGSIHHDAVTQQVWVDEPAYDEVVTRGYVCSVCGVAK